MADFHINLAKDLTSTEEERVRFYNGMLTYLAVCAAALVFVAYLSSVNLKSYLENNRERRQRIKSASAISGLEATAFEHPDKTYSALASYSGHITSLKQALGHRVQLLPVVHNLFVDMPHGVTLRSLSAKRNKLAFGLTMPMSGQSSDPGRDLQASWKKNEELMKRVISIKPVKGERRTMGAQSVLYYQYECILKK